MLLAMLLGWLERERHDVIAFLREENRALQTQLAGRRLQLTDAQRQRLATLGQPGRAVLRDVATLVTADTILRWHRELIARKYPTLGGDQGDQECSPRFGASWCGWPRRTRVGATRGFKGR